jgi:Tfp pilus assembly protein PilO
MNPRERLMLMIGVFLLGLVAFKFLVYDPQRAEYNSLVAAREAARAELTKDQQILARGEQVRAEYARLTAFVKTMEAKLPTTKEIPPLLTTMEQFTQRIGVRLETFHPTAVSAVQGAGAKPAASGGAAQTSSGMSTAAQALPYSRMELDMGLAGSFGQTLTYLRDLRSLPRLVVVDGITMSPRTYPQLGVSLITEIYILGTQVTGP